MGVRLDTVMAGDTGRTRLWGLRRRWQDITKIVFIGMWCDAASPEGIHPAKWVFVDT
jgi:hypothetical protein